ncbi:hypothetical protein B0H13DRAFT_1884405 [Mycena leptocephala]|nr:hypothetical protein B0H13DRAFT_1884405 [Mycena leptocephala]
MSLPDGLPADLQRQIEVSASVFAGATAVALPPLPTRIGLVNARINRIASSVYALGFTLFAMYLAWQASTSVWVLWASRSLPGKLRPLFGFWGHRGRRLASFDLCLGSGGIEVVVCHAATSV